MTAVISLDLSDRGRDVSPLRSRRAWRLSRATVGGLALAMVAADIFWVTSLHGAVGSIQRTETSPLNRWVRDSLIMLPLYVAAVWAALRLTQRWVGRRREIVRLAVALGLAVVFASAAGTAYASATAWWDYQRQADYLEELHAGHTIIGACVGLCASKHDTVQGHLRGIGFSAILMVVSNVILGAWVIALRGGRLWQRRTARATA